MQCPHPLTMIRHQDKVCGCALKFFCSRKASILEPRPPEHGCGQRSRTWRKTCHLPPDPEPPQPSRAAVSLACASASSVSGHLATRHFLQGVGPATGLREFLGQRYSGVTTAAVAAGRAFGTWIKLSIFICLCLGWDNSN